MRPKQYTCCFFGHRKIQESEELKANIYKLIEELIVNKKVDTFLFGSRSVFDRLCLRVVTLLKEKYPHIKRIYVRAEYQYINDDYRNSLLERYDDTYYPDCIERSGRAAYVERNREMIDKSEFCVVYFDENYTPPRRKNSKRDVCDYQPKSGTKLAYEYAVKKKVNVMNVFEM